MVLLPIIDISDLRSPSTAAQAFVAAEIDRALRDRGAFVASGHGIPSRIPEAGFARMKSLFALPVDVRRALRADLPGPAAGRGFVLDDAGGCGVGFVLGLDLPTVHPFVAGGIEGYGPNRWPPVDGFRDDITAWERAARDVSELVLAAIALAHGLPGDHLVDRLCCPRLSMRLEDIGPGVGRGAARWSTPLGGVEVAMAGTPAVYQLRSAPRTVLRTPVAPTEVVISSGPLLRRLSAGRYPVASRRWDGGGGRLALMTLANGLDHDVPADCLVPVADGGAGRPGFAMASGSGSGSGATRRLPATVDPLAG